MKAVGVIAEFNPFHNGHARLLSFAKKESGADFAVVMMSGSFVQRGLPAIMDKWLRARLALENGADLVLELPARYATGSAPLFALGAVAGLLCLPCVTDLAFGAEVPLSVLELVSSIEPARTDSRDFSAYVEAMSRKGTPYPKIRKDYILSLLEKQTGGRTPLFQAASAALKSPNSILAVEYLKARSLFGRPLSIHAISRNDSGYHSKNGGEFCSATALRGQLLQGIFPENGFAAAGIPLLEQQFGKTYPIRPSDFDLLLYDRLLSADARDLCALQDIDPSSASRFLRNRRYFEGYEAYAALCAHKQKTNSRILRMLCHTLLGIPQFYGHTGFTAQQPSPNTGTAPAAGMQPSAPSALLPADAALRPEDCMPCLRVLGMKKEASPCLKKASVPVITKLADAKHLFPDGRLPGQLSEDIHAARLFGQAVRSRFQTAVRDEYRISPWILP